MSKLAVQLEKLGISPGRFRVESISATEGAKWARVMTETNETIQELTTERIMEENEKARPKLTRFVRRMQDVPGVANVLELSEEARLQGIKKPIPQTAPVAGGE
jgi:hypothetical protein